MKEKLERLAEVLGIEGAVKNLPEILEKALDIGFTYAIAKGRNNYACRRKISELGDEFKIAPPDPDERHELEELIAKRRARRSR